MSICYLMYLLASVAFAINWTFPSQIYLGRFKISFSFYTFQYKRKTLVLEAASLGLVFANNLASKISLDWTV